MGFAGNLVDLPVVDVFQFLHISQRSGVIRFANPDVGDVSMVVRGGKLLSATSSMQTWTLGRCLRELFDVTEEAIASARERQMQGANKLLGVLLVEAGQASEEQIQQAMVALIEKLMQELVGWPDGTFVFEPQDIAGSDELAHYPALLREGAELDIQSVMMDAVRVFDEAEKQREEALRLRHREIEAQKQARLDNEAQGVGADADAIEALFDQDKPGAFDVLRDRLVVVVSDDHMLRASVAQHCQRKGFDSLSVSLVQEARGHLSRCVALGTDAVLVGDTAVATYGNFGCLGGMPGARRIREEFPQVPIVLVGDDIDHDTRILALGLGALFVQQKPKRSIQPRTYPARLETFKTYLSAAIEGAFHAAERAFLATRSMDDELRSLRDRVLELRTQESRSNVSLALLQHVARTTERAVLFLCRDRDLVAIGAFGPARRGKTVNDLLVGSLFSLASLPLVEKCIEKNVPYKGEVAKQAGFAAIFRSIGEPITGHGLILPVVARERVVAVVYGDNGGDWRPLITTYGLEILTSQVGLMLENLLLQRQRQAEAQTG